MSPTSASGSSRADSRNSADQLDEISAADKKRSSRACDQCRKTKSKCNRNTDPSKPCSSCEVQGTTCTFAGPTYKRGPPKGYIHAIELRLRQVESVLGTILGSSDPRAQSLVADLQEDDLAREILHRVDHGPFGPTGRQHQNSSSQEAFMAAVTKPFEPRNSARNDGKSNRESRVVRETVSASTNQDELQSPTHEWQSNLALIIEQGSNAQVDSTGLSNLNISYSSKRPTLEEMPGESDTVNGKLAVDENNQYRFHGEMSGMPLLSRSGDWSLDKNEGGLWRIPISRFAQQVDPWDDVIEESMESKMPPVEEQDTLIELYFTYVHTILPVVHRASFMEAYEARKSGYANGASGTSTTPTKRLSTILLLSIFAIASRYKEADLRSANVSEGDVWEAGLDYFISAREALQQVFKKSSISTCQSMTLLAYREFGMGCLEQSWMYIGIAIRMAQSLGLHRAGDKWQRFGVDIFSPSEKEERKLVWWSCAIVEKYISCSLGRPVSICYRNNDTELPQIPDGPSFEIEENDIWSPHPSVSYNNIHHPAKSHNISCLKASASLSVLVGLIVDEIYSLRPEAWPKQLTYYSELEERMDMWYNDLPMHLKLNAATGTSKQATPHVLCLHFQFWAAIILLHRRFIPQRRSSGLSNQNNLSMRAFDLCQSAATHISTIAMTMKETYSLTTSCAFLPSYLLSAGIVHIATLAMKPDDVQARRGLQQAMSALQGMEILWPSAFRSRELLNGAQVEKNFLGPNYRMNGTQQQQQQHAIQKRGFQDAFGGAHSAATNESTPVRRKEDAMMPSDSTTRWMAKVLGLESLGYPMHYVGGGSHSLEMGNTTQQETAHSGYPQGGPHGGARATNTRSGQLRMMDFTAPVARGLNGMTSQGENNAGYGGGAQQWPWHPNFMPYNAFVDGYDFQSFTNPDHYN